MEINVEKYQHDGMKPSLTDDLVKWIESTRTYDRETVKDYAQELNEKASELTGLEPVKTTPLNAIVSRALKVCRPDYINNKGYVIPYNLAMYIQEKQPCYQRNGMFFKYSEDEHYYKRCDNGELSRIFFDACTCDMNKTASKAEEFVKTFFLAIEPQKKSYDEKSFIACGDGVYSLESNTIVPYSDEYRLESKLKPVYRTCSDEEIVNSTFYKFLSDSVPNKQTQETIQEMIGLCLSPHAREVQRCFFLYGNGSNGKSVLIEVIKALFEHVEESVCGIPLRRAGERFGFDNVGASVANIVADEECTRLTNMSDSFKSFVAGESFTTEEKYKRAKNQVEYNVTSIYGLNSLPTSSDKSFGFTRRPCIIPFKVRFGDPEEIEAGTADKLKDRTLTDKIINNPVEMEIVLFWAIEGLKRLKGNGWKLSESPECLEVMGEYVRDNNSAEEFFQECLIRDPKAKPILIKDMYYAYKVFCIHEGIDKPLGRNKFNQHLKDGKGLRKDRLGKGVCWFDVRFADNVQAKDVERDMLLFADQH